MSRYTRLVVPGGTYFFTLRLEERGSTLLIDRLDLLRNSVRLCMANRPFRIDTAVILPDQLHMIWQLPPGDAAFSARWRQIKSTFSRHVDAPAQVSRSKRERGEKGIWQRRFWEHCIRDATDLSLHRSYALTAPVRAGLVERPQDWAASSIHRDGATGLDSFPAGVPRG
jgi:putative transposase